MADTLEDNKHKIEGNAIPRLFSFITFRKESVGGFLFNPYLFNELSLNEIQINILEHCNGLYSIKEITETISKKFKVSYNLAEQYVHEAFRIFNDYYAINWIDEKRDSVDLISDNKRSLIYPKTTDCQARDSGILTAPISILWEITKKCNLGCKHCLIDAGEQERNELSLIEVKKIIDQLAELKVFKITFGGGEPLVREDFLDILDYASGFNFGIKLSTNGILVNNSLLKRLEDTNVFSVQVSLDGIEKTHNAFRGNEKSFEKAVEALNAFSNAGYYTIMSTSITRYNINELEALLDLAVHYGVSSFKASPFIPIGRGKKNLEELAITQLDIKNLAKTMLQKKKEYNDIIDMQIDGLFPWLFDSCSECRSNTIGGTAQVGCSAGVSQVVITPTGEVLPCSFLRDFVAGDLRRNNLKDIWENSDIFNVFRNLERYQLEGECRNCEYVPHYCQGGCRAAAFAWTGNLFAHDPHCWKCLV